MPAIPDELRPALRSDHAGETGAVYIYRAIIALSRDPAIRAFAQEHLATEQRHLALMNDLVAPEQRSRIMPVWRLAGWLTGALPVLFGREAIFRTIEAVETFVDAHYRQQVEALAGRPEHRELAATLQACREDELSHRDDARGRLGPPGPWGRLWLRLVYLGSQIGVKIASRV